jgi:hypothetical protein
MIERWKKKLFFLSQNHYFVPTFFFVYDKGTFSILYDLNIEQNETKTKAKSACGQNLIEKRNINSGQKYTIFVLIITLIFIFFNDSLMCLNSLIVLIKTIFPTLFVVVFVFAWFACCSMAYIVWRYEDAVFFCLILY